MSNPAFKTMIESINAQLEVLNRNGYPLYDADNRDYFMSNIKYDSDSDQIIFETLEEKTQKE